MKLRSRGACPALAPTVAFAFCDLAGAGPRALLSLEPPAGCSMSATELDVDGLAGAERAFATARTAPAELITFADAATGAPRASLLLLLAPVAEQHATAVAAAVFDYVQQAGGAVSRLVVAAAMRFPPTDRDASVRALALSCGVPAGLPALPPDTPVNDALLAALLHFCRAGGAPTLALLAPGYRVRLPGSAQDDEAVAVACRLAASACTLLGCSFSPDAAKLRAKLVAWHSAADAEASVMYT